MSKDDPMDKDPLAPFFAAARDTAPKPSAALMARLQADAAQSLALRTQAAPRALAEYRPWRRAGGAALAAGLALAAVGGVWSGFSAPGPVQVVEAVLWGADPLDSLEDELDWLMAELDGTAGDGS